MAHWRNQGSFSRSLAKSLKTFDPKIKVLNVFWTWPVRKKGE